MAKATAVTKTFVDIEYTVLGNVFGLLIATGGLLAGAMVSQRSLDYWQEDIALLLIFAIMVFRLIRNFMDVLMIQQSVPQHHQPDMRPRAAIQPEAAVVGQIPAVSSLTPDEVVEQVVKRIEAQKAEAAKKNKFTE